MIFFRRCSSWKDAEKADVEFWQTLTGEERVAALDALRADHWKNPASLRVPALPSRLPAFHRRRIARWGRSASPCAIRTGTSEENPLPFFSVKQRIETALLPYHGRFVVIQLPNITNPFYGRGIGYSVERIILDEGTEVISATRMRQLSAASPSAI